MEEEGEEEEEKVVVLHWRGYLEVLSFECGGGDGEGEREREGVRVVSGENDENLVLVLERRGKNEEGEVAFEKRYILSFYYLFS